MVLFVPQHKDRKIKVFDEKYFWTSSEKTKRENAGGILIGYDSKTLYQLSLLYKRECPVDSTVEDESHKPKLFTRCKNWKPVKECSVKTLFRQKFNWQFFAIFEFPDLMPKHSLSQVLL